MSPISLLLAFSFLGQITVQSKPNIIIFLSDDLGYYDIGYQNNNEIKTPNINRFISDGLFLSNYYGQPACSPTRGSLLTSLYPLHHGLQTWIHAGNPIAIPSSATFLSQQLLQHDYATAMVGKWHLGQYDWKYLPTFRGFQSFYGYYGGGEDYYKHKNGCCYDFRDDVGLNCGSNCSRVASEAYGTYSTYLFTQRATEIIEKHDKSAPLFLYLAYQSVHAPAEVPEKYVIPYNTSIQDEKRRTFAGMLSCLDEGIGNITEVLSEQGYLENNTIIIFSSDNGGLIDIPQYNAKGIGSSNYPYRGGKQSLWEGGVRLTGFFWATPDILATSLRGQNYTQLMHVTDWFPTLLEAAGIEMSVADAIDGVSQWKGIVGIDDNQNDPYFRYRESIYFGNDTLAGNATAESGTGNGNNTALRSKWFKIYNSFGGYPNDWGPQPQQVHVLRDVQVVNGYDDCMLFDIQNDSYEYDDISAENQETVTSLLEMMNNITVTAIPLPVNHSCPNGNDVTHPVDPVVGPYWSPWCT